MRARFGFCALGLSALLTLTSCGGGPPRVLQSITVDAITSLSGSTYTATGHYSAAPMTVNNIQVAWFQTGTVVDPVNTWDFSTTTVPFKGVCAGGPGQFYVVAYASANPTAPASGSMPFSVFESLVEQRSVTQEDGFVAGSAVQSCTTAALRTTDPPTASGF
jgi:hypothetical protein